MTSLARITSHRNAKNNETQPKAIVARYEKKKPQNIKELQWPHIIEYLFGKLAPVFRNLRLN